MPSICDGASRLRPPHDAGLLEELRRPQEISAEPNFLILLGNRYGWQPLPEEISVAEFQQLENAISRLAADRRQSAALTLGKWYRRDDNNVPPVHILQPRLKPATDAEDQTDFTDAATWAPVQSVLWEIINKAYPPVRETSDQTEAAMSSTPVITLAE